MTGTAVPNLKGAALNWSVRLTVWAVDPEKFGSVTVIAAAEPPVMVVGAIEKVPEIATWGISCRLARVSESTPALVRRRV